MQKEYIRIENEGTDMVQYVNSITGEVFFCDEKETYSIVKKSTLQKRSQYLARRIKEPFIWLTYDECKPLFKNLDPSTITRIVYLATYTNYEKVLYRIDKKKIEERLQLTVNPFYEFYKKTTDENILIKNNSEYSINSEYFNKGKIPYKSERSHMRLFISYIRDLYERVSARSHKQIGYIFKLVPYINRQFNIICKNPYEKNFNKIKPLKTSEICDIVGYNKTKSSRLISDLSGELNLISCTEINDKTYIIVNPKICYGGDSISDAELMFIEGSCQPVNKV